MLSRLINCSQADSNIDTTPKLFDIDDITQVRTIMKEFHGKGIFTSAEYNTIMTILDASGNSSTSTMGDSDIQ